MVTIWIGMGNQVVLQRTAVPLDSEEDMIHMYKQDPLAFWAGVVFPQGYANNTLPPDNREYTLRMKVRASCEPVAAQPHSHTATQPHSHTAT